jgi:hypothetical protein
MIDLDPTLSPEAWSFLRRFLPLRGPVRAKLERSGGRRNNADRTRLIDELLLESLEVLREQYVAPDTPYGIRTYAKRVAQSLRRAEGRDAHLRPDDARSLDDDETLNKRIAKSFSDSWRNAGT